MTIEPPEAKKIPSPRTFHGDTVVDEFAWLADKDDPDTIDYLRAENDYTDELTAHLASLRDQIFEEIKARTQESDLSVPVRKGGWWHYSRTVEGKQYAVHCRRAVRPGEVIPPIPADGKPLDGEEELLDGNELAVGHEFFSLGAFRTSPDQRWLAYSTDFAGNERFIHGFRRTNIAVEVVEIGRSKWRLDPVSHTFHGRDIFAPVAAWLAAGWPLAEAGDPTDDVTALWPESRSMVELGRTP